jgi:uncharacterized protein YqjF (DUF2071 family)
MMAQTWDDLLFAHWRIAAEDLRRAVPEELPIDVYDGSAWIGVVPFTIHGLRLRLSPPLPGLSSFPELNVRTYVTIGGRPGVHFLSLDAASAPAVFAARRGYGLPYFRARMSAERRRDSIEYASERRVTSGAPAGFRASYRPRGPASEPVQGSLEHFLTERYCLYVVDRRGRVLRTDIHHPPWRLRAAEARIERNTMADPVELALDGEPLLHWAERQHALFWLPRPASAGAVGY